MRYCSTVDERVIGPVVALLQRVCCFHGVCNPNRKLLVPYLALMKQCLLSLFLCLWCCLIIVPPVRIIVVGLFVRTTVVLRRRCGPCSA